MLTVDGCLCSVLAKYLIKTILKVHTLFRSKNTLVSMDSLCL